MTDTNLLLFELFEQYPDNFFCIETTPELEKELDLEHLEGAFCPRKLKKNAKRSDILYREIMFIDDCVETAYESWSTSHERLILPEKLPSSATITLRFCYTWEPENADYIPKRMLEITWHTQL